MSQAEVWMEHLLTELGLAFEREYRFDRGCCGHLKPKHKATGCAACIAEAPFVLDGAFVHDYVPARQWRIDFWLPDHQLAIEVEGGAFAGGRHTRGSGFRSDCEKYNALTLAGGRLLRFMPEHIKNGVARTTLREAIGGL